MAVSKENLWGIGLMLVGVALAVFVGKLLGVICGIVGLILIVWAQFHKPEVIAREKPIPALHQPVANVDEDRPRIILESSAIPPHVGSGV